jgi:hypothetical protein
LPFFRTKKPLPFGTLGVHKKKEFSEANEAFFIFDCLYYNGESLLGRLSIFYSLVTSRRGWKESRARQTRVQKFMGSKLKAKYKSESEMGNAISQLFILSLVVSSLLVVNIHFIFDLGVVYIRKEIPVLVSCIHKHSD